MIWDVKLYVGGKVFTESVHAVNRNDAIDTAKNRNPHAKIIGVNPTTREEIWWPEELITEDLYAKIQIKK